MRYLALITAFFIVSALGAQSVKLRPLADTIGFAHTATQMNSVMERILHLQEKQLKAARKKAGIQKQTAFKVVISPHDDYTYTGYMYPLALENIKARTVILFGVAHQAKKLGLENQLIFDSYTHWRGPYGNVKVSALREELIHELDNLKILATDVYQVNDTMQKIEHSLEAEIPFLQYYNRNVEIIPILVPYMELYKMDDFGLPLACAIKKVTEQHKLKWGEDIALVISADAVHYGDEDWGGKNFAFYEADTSGYMKAVNHEHIIMDSCFAGPLTFADIGLFRDYTVQFENYKEYKWTWCGRYSVPMGLLTAFELSVLYGKDKPLLGTVLGYETSLSNKHIPVSDLGMGITAPAKLRHWVGYPAVGFK